MPMTTFTTMGAHAFDGCTAVATVTITPPLAMMSVTSAGVDPETLKRLTSLPTQEDEDIPSEPEQ